MGRLKPARRAPVTPGRPASLCRALRIGSPLDRSGAPDLRRHYRPLGPWRRRASPGRAGRQSAALNHGRWDGARWCNAQPRRRRALNRARGGRDGTPRGFPERSWRVRNPVGRRTERTCLAGSGQRSQGVRCFQPVRLPPGRGGGTLDNGAELPALAPSGMSLVDPQGQGSGWPLGWLSQGGLHFRQRLILLPKGAGSTLRRSAGTCC